MTTRRQRLWSFRYGSAVLWAYSHYLRRLFEQIRQSIFCDSTRKVLLVRRTPFSEKAKHPSTCKAPIQAWIEAKLATSRIRCCECRSFYTVSKSGAQITSMTNRCTQMNESIILEWRWKDKLYLKQHHLRTSGKSASQTSKASHCEQNLKEKCYVD